MKIEEEIKDIMDKTVYFLGAGATKAVCGNAPLNNDLVEKALRDFHGTPEAEQIENFIRDIFKERRDPPKDNQIWNLLDYLIQQGKSASLIYSIEKISDIRESLLSLVVKEFKKSLENSDRETYRKFVVSINTSRPTVISTNYDILIDNALLDVSSLNYGAKIRWSLYLLQKSQNVSDREIDDFCSHGFNRPHIAGDTNLNSGFVKLLKIHGSLNWLYCPKCDEVDLTIRTKGTEELLEKSGVTCRNDNCTKNYEPLLITPTMFKNYENRFIKEIWNHAKNNLINAENLIFIGYALKDEDYQIRCLLMEALLNKKGGYRKVIVVEKEPSSDEDREHLKNIEKKYKNLYGEIVEVQPIGFGTYVDRLSR